jgi:glycosyltransferase involved in cell wall biosynthesis
VSERTPGPAPPAKKTVVFLGFTKITVGAGVEQFLLNTVRNAPLDRFRVILVETDFAPARRWSDAYVAEALRGVEVISLQTPRRSYDPDHLIDLASKSLWLYLGTAAVLPFVRAVYSAQTKRRNRASLRLLRSADLVYLLRNEDVDWLGANPARTVVVGSTHCDDLSGGLVAFETLPGRAILRRLYRKSSERNRRGAGPIRAYHVTQPVFWQRRVRRAFEDRLLPLGVDTRRFHPDVLPHPEGAVRFLSVGRLESQKGTDLLLQAWSHVPSPRAELHLVGDGRLKELVQHAARADPRIHAHGILAPDELAELYASCDVFVLPSRYETLGLVVLEALSSGLYVVASEALRGVFDGFAEAGVIEYRSNTPADLGSRLDQLARGPLPLTPERRAALHERVEGTYDWKRVTADLFAWFQELLDTPRGSLRAPPSRPAPGEN